MIGGFALPGVAAGYAADSFCYRESASCFVAAYDFKAAGCRDA